MGPWLRYAEEGLGTREAVIWQSSVNLTGDPSSPVRAMLGLSGILRSGLMNPRYAFLPINPRLPGALAFASAVGAQPLSELDVELPRGRLECRVVDYGPGGILGFQRDHVYHATGTAPPSNDPRVLAAAVKTRCVISTGPESLPPVRWPPASQRRRERRRSRRCSSNRSPTPLAPAPKSNY